MGETRIAARADFIGSWTPPNNGMHPTRDTTAFIFLHRLGRAGDAGRYAASSLGRIIPPSWKPSLTLGGDDMFRRMGLRCSFCGKGEAEVQKLVAGPRVYICDVCVTTASRIMNDPSGGHRPPAGQPAGRRKLLTRVRRVLRGGGWRRISSPGAHA